MEVKCPHCTSRFNLPDNLAKPGVKLRCSVCKTVFPFAPEPEAVLPGEDELPDMQERPSGGRRKFWVARGAHSALSGRRRVLVFRRAAS